MNYRIDVGRYQVAFRAASGVKAFNEQSGKANIGYKWKAALPFFPSCFSHGPSAFASLSSRTALHVALFRSPLPADLRLFV